MIRHERELSYPLDALNFAPRWYTLHINLNCRTGCLVTGQPHDSSQTGPRGEEEDARTCISSPTRWPAKHSQGNIPVTDVWISKKQTIGWGWIDPTQESLHLLALQAKESSSELGCVFPMAMQTIIIIDPDFTSYEPSLSPHEVSHLSSTLSEAQGVLYNLATTHRDGIPYEQSITEAPAVSLPVIAFPQIKIHRSSTKP